MNLHLNKLSGWLFCPLKFEVHVSFWIIALFGYMHRSGIAGSCGSSIFICFEEPLYCFPQWVHQFTFPPTMWKGPPFFTPSPPFVVAAQSLSCVPLFVTLWTTAHQASLLFTFSLSLLKLLSIESVMSSNHLCHLSPPAINLSQHQDLFQWVRSLHQAAKGLELQLHHQSFQWIFRTDVL